MLSASAFCWKFMREREMAFMEGLLLGMDDQRCVYESKETISRMPLFLRMLLHESLLWLLRARTCIHRIRYSNALVLDHCHHSGLFFDERDKDSNREFLSWSLNPPELSFHTVDACRCWLSKLTIIRAFWS